MGSVQGTEWRNVGRVKKKARIDEEGSKGRVQRNVRGKEKGAKTRKERGREIHYVLNYVGGKLRA